MAKLTNGRTVCYVSDEKAEKLASILGFTIIEFDSPKEEEPEIVIPEPRKPRGRPRKVS